MPITQLNHYFVRANDLEETKEFYANVLGFEVMPRPDFGLPSRPPPIAPAVQDRDEPYYS